MCRFTGSELRQPGFLALTNESVRVRVSMVMRIQFVGVALTSALAHAAIAQSPSQASAPMTPAGIWRGTSLCLVRPSACNDEVVVYRITSMKASDSVAIDARKIVRGDEEEMGVLGCRVVGGPASRQITCTMPQGVWQFTVRADSLTGELRLPDNTRFREVRTVRALK